MNPYQQNIDIIKAFFKRKVVLFYAFLTILPIFSILFIKTDVLIDTVKNISDNQFLLRDIGKSVNLAGILSSSYVYFIFEILIAVVFLLFFVKAENKDTSLKAPVNMFRIISVIELIVTLFISLAMVLIAFVFSIYSLANLSTLTSLMFIPFMFAAVICVLVDLFFQTLFAVSIKDSVNSIYLKKTGAKPYGIMNAIMAALFVYFAVLIALHGLSRTPDVIPLIIFLCLTAAKYALGSAVGLKYAKYIEGFSDSSTAREITEQSGESGEDQPEIIICKKCGKVLSSDDYFCNHCGTPVEKK